MRTDEAFILLVNLVKKHCPDLDIKLSINKRLKRRAGRTRGTRTFNNETKTYDYKVTAIDLSFDFVVNNTVEHVEYTILHEIAHALTIGHHHDYVWKAKFKELTGHTGSPYHPKELNGIIVDFFKNTN